MEDTESAEDSSGEVAVVTDNQRAHERFRVNLKALIRLSDGTVVHAQAVDLSMGGIYLEYGAPADAGSVFELAFDLPFAVDFKRVIVKARVVRTVMIGSRSLYGLAFLFTEFVKDSEDILEQYMQLRKLKTI